MVNCIFNLHVFKHPPIDEGKYDDDSEEHNLLEGDMLTDYTGTGKRDLEVSRSALIKQKEK